MTADVPVPNSCNAARETDAKGYFVEASAMPTESRIKCLARSLPHDFRDVFDGEAGGEFRQAVGNQLRGDARVGDRLLQRLGRHRILLARPRCAGTTISGTIAHPGTPDGEPTMNAFADERAEQERLLLDLVDKFLDRASSRTCTGSSTTTSIRPRSSRR